MILPCTNLELRADVTQRPAIDCKPKDYLSMDVEQDLSRLIKMECEFHVAVEEKKQQMECVMSYNHALAFKTIDPGNLGFIEIKTIDSFLKT